MQDVQNDLKSFYLDGYFIKDSSNEDEHGYCHVWNRIYVLVDDKSLKMR
jgi:hypothetical protein